MRLKDKVVVITGSSRGIGRTTALLFAREGARTVVNHRDSERQAEEVVRAIVSAGGEAMPVRADVSEPDDVRHLFREAVERYGTVDILVNNAGILRPSPFAELTREDILTVLGTNFVGTVLCSQQAARIMLPRRSGRIVNISSISGSSHFGTPGNLHYAASKAAVTNFTGILAKALAPHITVNAVAPGFVATGMGHSPEYVLQAAEVPLRRLVRAEEVAEVCLFLACGQSSAMTGETIVVDAGFQLR